MEHVDGRIVWDPAMDLHAPSERMATVFDAAGTRPSPTLCTASTWTWLGLGDYGRQGGFVVARPLPRTAPVPGVMDAKSPAE